MPRYTILFGLLLLSFFTIAQQQRGVLWEITGNGLEKPSYLFGTMHLRDKAILSVGDSVLHAIGAAEAFALEVLLDSIQQELCESAHDGDVEEMVMHPMPSQRRRGGAGAAEDEIPVKLDQYLYLYADRAGKQMYGLEPMFLHRQSELEQKEASSPAETIDMLRRYDHYVSSYTSDDLDAMNFSGLYDDSLFIKRNVTMRNSMMRIMPHSSLFAAVGVAHLPGEYGLLTLLAKEGFQLRPVPRGKRNDPDLNVLERLNENWQTMEYPAMGYRIQLPGEPCTSVSGDAANIHMYVDPFTEQIFAVGATLGDINTGIKELKRNFEESVANRMPVGSKIKSKNIQFKGIQGIELEVRLDSYILIYRLCIYREITYYMFFGHPADYHHAAQMQQFFDSFEFLERDLTWKTQTVKEGACEFMMPGTPEYVMFRKGDENSSEEGLDIHMYFSTDDDAKSQLVFQYFDIPDIAYVGNDSAIFSAMDSMFVELQLKKLQFDSISSENGYNKRSLAADLKDGNYLQCEYHLRGSRGYILLTLTAGKKEETSEFFESFRFVPFEPSELKDVSINDGEITIRLPDEVTSD
jgi:hypothetical protein